MRQLNEGSYGDLRSNVASQSLPDGLQAIPWASHRIRCQQAHDRIAPSQRVAGESGLERGRLADDTVLNAL